MAGLAGAITPHTTGKIVIYVSGDVNNSISEDGVNINLRYGTGAAPANGEAGSGTTCAGPTRYIAAAAGNKESFSLQCVASVSNGTAYWIDIAFLAVTGGTATLGDVTVGAYELR